MTSASAYLKRTNRFLETYGLGEFLPYRSHDPTTQLFFNERSVGFVLETLPLVGCKEEYLKQLTGVFQHTLPLGSSLQGLLMASNRIYPTLERWQAARQRSLSALQDVAQARVQYLVEHIPQKGLRTFKLILSYSQPLSLLDKGQSVGDILSLREQIGTTLSGWGLPVKVWKAEDLIRGLEELLNPTLQPFSPSSVAWDPSTSSPGSVPLGPSTSFADSTSAGPSTSFAGSTCYNSLEMVNQQLMHPETHIFVEPSRLVFGEEPDICKSLRLYTPRVFPNFWHQGGMGILIGDAFDEFLRLRSVFFLSYGVHICDEKFLKTHMLAKCGNVEKQATSPVANYFPSIKHELDEWTYVREKFEEGQRLVRTRFQVGLIADPGQLAREEQTLFNLFRSQRWELACDRYLQLPSFISCLPMTWGEGSVEDSKRLGKTKLTLSHEPANLLPLQGEWFGTRSPGMLLVGRRGQVFTWSPFDNTNGNYNTCVVGRSGSGKSVFMQELLTSMLGAGGRVFVLDVGRSFEKTVKLLKGTYLEFSIRSKICINPFTYIPTDDEEASSDALSMLKPILSLMAAPKEGTRDIEDAYLEQALQEAWVKRQNKATISDVAEWLSSQEDGTARSLGARLRPYTKGTYKKFFEGDANIDLSDKLVVVELEELKERKDLQSVIVQMVILQIANSVYGGDRKTPSCLILDEAWDMLRGKQSGVFIETAARRLRKYYGGLVVGTQSINDFYATPGAQAAFDNADWMCLLSQKDESIDLLKTSKRLSIDPNMERTLRSLRTDQGNYAEIMIKGPDGFAVGRLYLDPFSKILYSTKAEEFAAVQGLMTQGKSLVEAITHVAEGTSR